LARVLVPAVKVEQYSKQKYPHLRSRIFAEGFDKSGDFNVRVSVRLSWRMAYNLQKKKSRLSRQLRKRFAVEAKDN
jgi:hypothetical protein